VIKSRRTRWEGREARKGELRNAYSILVGNLEGKRGLLEDIGVDEKIILKWV
jgi:hypothetical protein